MPNRTLEKIENPPEFQVQDLALPPGDWRRSVRGLVRRSVLDLLSTYSWLRGEFARRTIPVVQVINLHGVPESKSSDFGALLEQLRKRYEFIPYSAAVEKIRTGSIDRNYATVTFDDGLKNHKDAAKVMREHQIQGCFFVTPAVMDLEQSRIPDYCKNVLRIQPTEFMDWGDLTQLLDWGHEVGSHTVTHPNMSKISLDQVRYELETSRDIITAKLGQAKHFAWPLGKFSHFSVAAARAVQDAGYESCASAERGSHAAHKDQQQVNFCLRRDLIEVQWPTRHSEYFLMKSRRVPLKPTQTWPAEWLPLLNPN
ncbi:MAG: polysaccharide deacetylase family protein [Pirellulaceae bacterium]|nr:polysaccharide deacetylase family protein [Pirellulaceae bacterium]